MRPSPLHLQRCGALAAGVSWLLGTFLEVNYPSVKLPETYHNNRVLGLYIVTVYIYIYVPDFDLCPFGFIWMLWLRDPPTPLGYCFNLHQVLRAAKKLEAEELSEEPLHGGLLK